MIHPKILTRKSFQKELRRHLDNRTALRYAVRKM